MERSKNREFLCHLWAQREGLVNYAGMLLAQLGTSGLITNAKAIAWTAFGAFAMNQLSQHIRQVRRIREERAAKGLPDEASEQT